MLRNRCLNMLSNMHHNSVLSILVLFTFLFCSLDATDYFDGVQWYRQQEICSNDPPKSRLEYILSMRQPDYGWKEHTHRANIALAVNNYKGDEKEMRRMELQLEVELTKALLRNSTSIMHENDLALYIHALVATNRNPRDFYGIDLVADLLYRVNKTIIQKNPVHPFLILTLCNSHAVEFDHLYALKRYTAHQDGETRQQTELKALAVKAMACAATLNNANKFSEDIDQGVKCLLSKHKSDGSFGNAYTTSLAVQALIANDTRKVWNTSSAFVYLEKEASVHVNMIKAYYIEMALNAENVKFIHQLYKKGRITGSSPIDTEGHFITYTVKKSYKPNMYTSISLRIPPKMNFFEVMKLCVKESKDFGFTHYLNDQGEPIIVSVAEIPNDAEENMFWMMCVQRTNHKGRHSSRTDHHTDSPATFFPNGNEHIILWYRNSVCNEEVEGS